MYSFLNSFEAICADFTCSRIKIWPKWIFKVVYEHNARRAKIFVDIGGLCRSGTGERLVAVPLQDRDCFLHALSVLTFSNRIKRPSWAASNTRETDGFVH